MRRRVWGAEEQPRMSLGVIAPSGLCQDTRRLFGPWKAAAGQGSSSGRWLCGWCPVHIRGYLPEQKEGIKKKAFYLNLGGVSMKGANRGVCNLEKACGEEELVTLWCHLDPHNSGLGGEPWDREVRKARIQQRPQVLRC